MGGEGIRRPGDADVSGQFVIESRENRVIRFSGGGRRLGYLLPAVIRIPWSGGCRKSSFVSPSASPSLSVDSPENNSQRSWRCGGSEGKKQRRSLLIMRRST
ncbi:hypothetical protein BHE74_00034104 [Ensete ventricosum]|nr:hypothetical protein BHE74_00034104 [Ensete ventricosum]